MVISHHVPQIHQVPQIHHVPHTLSHIHNQPFITYLSLHLAPEGLPPAGAGVTHAALAKVHLQFDTRLVDTRLALPVVDWQQPLGEGLRQVDPDQRFPEDLLFGQTIQPSLLMV